MKRETMAIKDDIKADVEKLKLEEQKDGISREKLMPNLNDLDRKGSAGFRFAWDYWIDIRRSGCAEGKGGGKKETMSHYSQLTFYRQVLARYPKITHKRPIA